MLRQAMKRRDGCEAMEWLPGIVQEEINARRVTSADVGNSHRYITAKFAYLSRDCVIVARL